MLFIGNGTVILNAVELRRSVGVNFGNNDFYFHGLHLMGKDLTKHLGVLICEAASVDILSAVLVALEFGVANACNPELVEFVIPTDATEGYSIVYF